MLQFSHETSCHHLIIGTHGSRLHGGNRPTVDRRANIPGDPFLTDNPGRNQAHQSCMLEQPVYLTNAQRCFIEDEIINIAQKETWHPHAIGCQPDHLHLLIHFEREGKALRKYIKSQLSKALNQKYGKRLWWAKSGAVKPVISHEYFEEVKQYIIKQRCPR